MHTESSAFDAQRKTGFGIAFGKFKLTCEHEASGFDEDHGFAVLCAQLIVFGEAAELGKRSRRVARRRARVWGAL